MKPPARSEWRPETRALHDAIDGAGDLGQLNPQTPSIMGDMLGSKHVIAWQEAKVASLFMQAHCWGTLPPLYGRYGTTQTAALIDTLQKAEAAKAVLVTDCGMQAVALTFDVLVEPNATIVCMRQVYNKGKSYLNRLCERLNSKLLLVDESDPNALLDALSSQTCLVFAETYSNPLLYAQDIHTLVQSVRDKAPKAKLVVDSTIASPWGMKRPLVEMGVDCVVASGSKSLGGQDADLCGYIATNDIALANDIMDLMAMRGGILDWRRASTVHEHFEESKRAHAQRCTSAIEVADFLAKHPAIETVNHPSRPEHPQATVIAEQYQRTASLMSFRLNDASEDDTKHFCDVLAMTECVRYATSFDGLVTKINHHRSVSEYFTPPDVLAKIGIHRLARLAIGLEHPKDIVDALNWALANHRRITVDQVEAWQAERLSTRE